MTKRDEASLIKTMGALKIYNNDTPVTLSLNEHEAAAIFAMNGETPGGTEPPALAAIESVRAKTGLDELIIHTPHYAAAAEKGREAVTVTQKYCEKPIRSAGAGDTFNGGYIAARLAGLDMPERLQVANAGVSFFLMNAFPPCRGELKSVLA